MTGILYYAFYNTGPDAEENRSLRAVEMDQDNQLTLTKTMNQFIFKENSTLL